MWRNIFVFVINFVDEWNTYIFIYSFDHEIARTDRVCGWELCFLVVSLCFVSFVCVAVEEGVCVPQTHSLLHQLLNSVDITFVVSIVLLGVVNLINYRLSNHCYHQVTHPIYRGSAHPAYPPLVAHRWDGCITTFIHEPPVYVYYVLFHLAWGWLHVLNTVYLRAFPLVSWLIQHVLAGAPCIGIEVSVKGLGTMKYVLIVFLRLLWHDMISWWLQHRGQ